MHYVALYSQNGDRILITDSGASHHTMNSGSSIRTVKNEYRIRVDYYTGGSVGYARITHTPTCVITYLFHDLCCTDSCPYYTVPYDIRLIM